MSLQCITGKINHREYLANIQTLQPIRIFLGDLLKNTFWRNIDIRFCYTT